ncbi:tetratricopeptide repeat protein [Notoacmeibacter marinus]|uniref:tetratricopeptide repeat protein n=1 Tax=Notoacmeibacter marinus TaxID=1876515 RepID=UPI000DF2AC58|nr:hypothetical protein [Notoacmeibacter marinus]
MAESARAREEVVAIAGAAAVANPLENRFLSSMALSKLYEGEAGEAVELAKAALRLNQTDRLAASIVAASHVQAFDYEGAVSVVSRALQRNPSTGRLMVELFSALTANEEGREAVRKELARHPVWAAPAIYALARQGNGYQLVYLLTSGYERDPEEGYGQVDRIVARQFTKHGQFRLGYRHFLQLLPAGKKVGYVFNSNFADEPSGMPWDWNFTNTTAATVKRVDGDDPHVEVIFRDKPVLRVGFSSYIAVPPGQLRFRASARALDLRSSKPLEFQIDCVDPRRSAIATLELPSGSYDWKDFEVEFDNTGLGCRFGNLFLTGRSVKGSFRTRYGGKVEVRSIELLRADY